MQELSRSQKSRFAIRSFKTIADALALRGMYKPSGRSGKTLENALRTLSPEIYGTMNDSRSIELKGLHYVLDRLPKGIETCNRIVLTAKDEFDQTGFEKIVPLKRRRISYRVSAEQMCFVITTGLSEVYDVLTHLTFLNIEAHKIYAQMRDESGEIGVNWKELEKAAQTIDSMQGRDLDQAIWNLSILLGRSYQETRSTFDELESERTTHHSNNGLFQIIYGLGKRVEAEESSRDKQLVIYFTPSLQDMIGRHAYGPQWAARICSVLRVNGLEQRRLHIISANMHSIVNLLYGYAAVCQSGPEKPEGDLYRFLLGLKDRSDLVRGYAREHGFIDLPDTSGMLIDCQIIDMEKLSDVAFHPEIHLERDNIRNQAPVLIVMDYAFGTQAYEAMDELLEQLSAQCGCQPVKSISIMGKAGILPGKKGDIMVATAHVMEGTPHNYLVQNELQKEDFEGEIDVFVGPMVTVLGTSLQNRDVLERFQNSSWKAIGLEMEGGHYQRAISGAIIRGYLPAGIRLRYAYYASDNPLVSGQTLASGSMGDEGIKPTYLITKVIVEKIGSQTE
ncbi:DUF6909 family protein [Desulfatirhabdium butyrativorans]|uniref:DUF6909 family protein n=1 Tax=Desulfatirhabdium butyrativorans TaxID=340467 RepID=UPI0003FF2B19|nr:hypothetical protein [Desulfatirhabdium butyrativorans]